MLPLPWLYSVELYNDLCAKNWKGFGRKRLRCNPGYIPAFTWKEIKGEVPVFN
jgi:hypothetical protein